MPQTTIVLVSVFDENNAEVSQMIFSSTWAAADALREMVRDELRNRIRTACMEHGASMEIANQMAANSVPPRPLNARQAAA